MLLTFSGGKHSADFYNYAQLPHLLEAASSLDLMSYRALFQNALSIREQREEARTTFLNYFVSELNYRFIPAEPIVPRAQVDTSTLFTSASITPLKPFLRDGTVPINGLAVCQPCMRLHNLVKAYDRNSVSHWLSEFEMFGTVTTPQKFEALEQEVYNYLTGVLEIDPRRISIAASSHDPDLTYFWQGKLGRSQIEKDQHNQAFYQWKYGMEKEDITGQGIHIYVHPPHSDAGYPRHHVANIIRLEQGGRVIGYEFAIGLEMQLCSTMNLPRPIFATPLSGLLNLQDKPNLQEKLADFLSASVTLLRAGIEPENNGHGHSLKKLLKGIVRTAQDCGMSLEHLNQLIQIYEEWCYPCQQSVASTLALHLDKQQHILETASRRFSTRLQNFKARISAMLPDPDFEGEWIISEELGQEFGRFIYASISELGVAEQPEYLLEKTLAELNIFPNSEVLDWMLGLGRQTRAK